MTWSGLITVIDRSEIFKPVPIFSNNPGERSGILPRVVLVWDIAELIAGLPPWYHSVGGLYFVIFVIMKNSLSAFSDFWRAEMFFAVEITVSAFYQPLTVYGHGPAEEMLYCT